MLKDILKQLPLTTFIVIFLYVCGGLYLIGYWGTFGIDISNIVGIVEIPKGFIFPFVLSQGYFLMYPLFDVIVPIKTKDSKPKEYKYFIWKLLLDVNIYIIILGGLVYPFFLLYKGSVFFWFFYGFALSIALVIKTIGMPFVKEIIPSYPLRRYIVIMIIFTPIISLVTGKIQSLEVFNNNHIKYIKAEPNNNKTNILATNDTTRLKLLGFLGEKVIISSLDNKKQYILNQSSVDVVGLEDVEKK